MRTRGLAQLCSCMIVAACSSRAIGESEEASANEETSATEETVDGGETSETDTASETTGVETLSCDCVESLELVCDDLNRPMALRDCDVPAPCPSIDLDNPDADVATCILQLLIDQQPSRFDYVAHVPGDWGDDTYLGSFFILGVGAGIDLECVHPSYDCCAPPPPVATPAFHAIEGPDYYEQCLGKTATVMAGCIFNGVEMQGIVPVCSG